MRVLLAVVHPEQGDLFAVVLLIRQLPAQLRQGRQPGLRPDIPPVGRTLLIVSQVRGVLPARQVHITIETQLHEVTPVFKTGTGPGMVPGQVVVNKSVGTEHPCIIKMPDTGSQVGLGPAVGPVQAALREYQVIALVIQRHQQVELRVLQGKIFVRVQLHAGSTEVAQPLLKGPAGLSGGHTPGHGGGRVTFCAASQEASGP